VHTGRNPSPLKFLNELSPVNRQGFQSQPNDIEMPGMNPICLRCWTSDFFYFAQKVIIKRGQTAALLVHLIRFS
jgi:hypothetical protein